MKACREDVLKIFDAALCSVNPFDLLCRIMTLKDEVLSVSGCDSALHIDLGAFEKILVIGAGKAGASMARAVECVLEERISAGVVSVKRGYTEPLKRIRIIEAGHPVPDEQSMEAAKLVLDLGRKADERTLFINLISGGGSALLCAPYEEGGVSITLEEKRKTTEALLRSGATIQEMNCVRKHISALKGGRLAELLFPATSLNLVLSDVVGDDVGSIASGLCSPDETTFAQALAVVRNRGVDAEIPPRVLDVLRRGAAGSIPETPKPGDRIFSRTRTLIIGSNRSALAAAERRAKELGYTPLVLTSHLTGEAREVAKVFLAVANDIEKYGCPIAKPACVLAGGETTVTLRGSGKGGRNQEMVLSFLSGMADSLAGLEGICFFSGATDGSDGPTDAAGAFASIETLGAARRAGLDPMHFLSRNDSYAFFNTTGSLVKTGPTNTNVCDIQIMLVV